MKKTQYVPPEMEVLRIEHDQHVLQGSEVDVNVGSSRGGYDSPINDYEDEWN